MQNVGVQIASGTPLPCLKKRESNFFGTFMMLFFYFVSLDYLRNVNAGIPERKAQRIATMACFLAQPAKSYMTSVRRVNGP